LRSWLGDVVALDIVRLASRSLLFFFWRSRYLFTLELVPNIRHSMGRGVFVPC